VLIGLALASERCPRRRQLFLSHRVDLGIGKAEALQRVEEAQSALAESTSQLWPSGHIGATDSTFACPGLAPSRALSFACNRNHA